ncbi:amino acid permease 3 [Novymonas esmeraldas]|uniref:Amino acid permease 3 n=1 Tax=Novymonas esmeraldas TaxID=1808958 RepID=A0AAW0F6Q7_9TRYP
MKRNSEPVHHEHEHEKDLRLQDALEESLESPNKPDPKHGHDHVAKLLTDTTVVAELHSGDDRPATVIDPCERKKRNIVSRFTEWLIPYGGVISNCFSLGSVTLGAGIISMPSSFAMSGIIMSVIYLVVITSATVYTMTLMGFAMKATGCLTFESLGRVLFGRGWDYFVGFVLWLSSFGTAVAYISAVGSLITPILENAPGTPAYLKTTAGNRCITSLIWLVLMVPTVIPKHLNSIRYVSAFGVTMVLYFVVTIVIHSSTNGMKKGMRDDMKYFTTGNQAVYGLSIFIFAYLCQTIAGNVYSEQRPRPSIRQLTIASAISMTVCMIFYIFAGVFGYFDFAGETKDAILENFDPIAQPYMMVAYFGMLIKLCAAYAMNMIPCRNFTYHCLGWDLETVPYWKHIAVVGSTSVVILICGLFIPSINTALGLVGSLCGGFIGFIFPALFWMYCGNWSLKTVGIWHWIGTYLLIVVGVIAIVFGTITTVYYSFFV